MSQTIKMMCYLTIEQYNELFIYSIKRGVTPQEVVRKVLKKFLTEEEAKHGE